MTIDNTPVAVDPLATSEVALTIATLNNEALDKYLCEMPAERLAEFAIRIAAVSKLTARAKQVAHARLVELGQTGVTFTDPADGTAYHFTGGRHRRIKNVQGFVEFLAVQGIDARPLIPWLSSNAFRVGQDIEGDERIKEAVKEYAIWEDDAVSMVELDERGRPKR